MTFGAPLGLAALAGVPLLVALYFFRRRSAPRQVSALFLWRATEDLTQAGPSWKKLSRELSLALEILATIAAAMFLADVRCAPLPGMQTHTVVVLDSGLSMQARPADRPSVADRAIELTRTRLERVGGLATIITTGPKTHVLAGPAISVQSALARLKGWSPSEPSHPFDSAWALARELAGAGGQVIFITDALEKQTPKGIEVVALGDALPNVGFIGAYRADSATVTTLRLRVANFDSVPRTVTVHLANQSGKLVRDVPVSIEAGGSSPLALDLPAVEVIVATLPDDALAWDNHLTLGPERPRTIHIRNGLATDTLAADAVSRFAASAPNVVLGGAPELTFLPEDAKEATPWSVLVGAPATDAAPVRAFVGPFVAAKDHALLEDVSFEGLVWPAGVSPRGTPLVSAGDRTLISEERGPRFHLNIDLARSNVPRTTAWPVLLGNLVEMRRSTLPGFGRHNVASGESAALTLGDGTWTLTGEDQTRTLAGTLESLTLAPGGYALLHDGQALDTLQVNAIDAGESDLRTRGSGARAASERIASSALLPPDRSAWPLLLMIAALLVDYALAAPGRRRFALGRA
jgi:hypothetical protein